MQFSVIYSVDLPLDERISDYRPPQLRSLWDQTEGDESYEFSYLEGRWSRGKHRKWCAILTKEQFEAFVQQCNLYAEQVETLGSLGAPGCGYGWAPAISFTNDNPDAFQSAYVTPLPTTRKKALGRRDWRRVRQAILRTFG